MRNNLIRRVGTACSIVRLIMLCDEKRYATRKSSPFSSRNRHAAARLLCPLAHARRAPLSSMSARGGNSPSSTKRTEEEEAHLRRVP